MDSKLIYYCHTTHNLSTDFTKAPKAPSPSWSCNKPLPRDPERMPYQETCHTVSNLVVAKASTHPAERNFQNSCITDDNISVLLRMPNVILTPHLAFFTREPWLCINSICRVVWPSPQLPRKPWRRFQTPRWRAWQAETGLQPVHVRVFEKNMLLLLNFNINNIIYINITYLPHKAVAEVSKDKEPIGRECAEINWFENELMSDSREVRFKRFWVSIDLRFNWFRCQSMCASNDFGCLLIRTSSEVVVNWFEIQLVWLSINLRFKWFGCQSIRDSRVGSQLIWDSSDLVVNRCAIRLILFVSWFRIPVSWLSIDVRFNWVGCQLMCDSNYFVKRSFSARLPSKLKLWSSKTKHFCETSFKNEALKIKNEAFLRDFLQNWSFEDQKPSISARLPSKLQLSSSKTKLLCETSFKNKSLKIKNEAILRDFLQKRSFEAQKRSFCARVPSKLACGADAWPQNSNTF